MRWQPGGNLEPVRIICETDWRQCIQAILRYIWTEIVTDVVDCLTTESSLWRIIAICIICIMLLRIFYVKRKWVNRSTPSKYILSRVGCKVDDLELKINILTYKLQYGTWPLPHQIQKSALKRQLRNLRLTLSTSSDRKEWIKHILLSSSTSNTYLSPPKLDSISVHHMNKLFDTKTGCFLSENQQDVYPTDQSDIKSSKTSSVESIKKTNLEGVHRRGLSKSENLGESRSVTRQLSLLPRKESDYFWKKTRKQKRPRLSMSRSKITACDKYTESIVECKRFLKELKESNKKLELNCSSSAITNDSSSFYDSWTDEKSSLHAQTTDARNASRRCEIIGEVKGTLVKVEREKKDLNIFMDISNGVQIDRIKSNGLLSSLNSNIRDDFSNSLTTDEPKSILSQNNNVIEMSQIRLYQIKRKLESLDSILRAYSMLDSCVTRNVERSKEKNNEIQAIYRNVADTLDTIKLEIENINETKRNKITFEVNPKEYSDKMLQTTSSDYELFESIDSERSSSISMKSYNERLIEDPLDLAIAGKNQRSEKRPIKTDATFALSRSNHVIILDQESLLNDFRTQEEKELSGYPVSLEIDEDPSILSTNSSQLEISKDSDLENKSTAMLIREALQCKKELLSRVKLHKFYSNVEVRKEREETTEKFEDVNTAWLDTEKSFQSKLLDIITEESTSSCTDKTSRTYIFLQMKQSSEMSDGSSSSSNVEIDNKKQKENIKNGKITSEMFDSSKEAVPIVSSRYFSFNDLSFPPKYQNVILQELPSDSMSSLPNRNESIKSTNSLQGKRRYREVATWDDDDDIDDGRKRHCHRDGEKKKLLISSKRLRRAKSVPESFRKRETGNVRRNINEVILKTTRDVSCTKSFEDAPNEENTIPRKNENETITSFGAEDLLSWNRTTDSSSAGSIKCQFTIDNGSMTNLFSSNDSNLEICKKYSSSKERDGTVYGQDLSLRRRPGMLSFAQLKMNTLLADENDIFKNPYFLGETTLSEATCGETIELNLIPISVSIDSHESNLFAVTHGKIFDDLNKVSSTLRISYNNDLEIGNVTEITEDDENDEIDKKESQIIPDNRKSIVCISDRATKLANNDGRKKVQRKWVLNETKRSNITNSRSNVISQKSSSYFTGDTSSSMSKADFESCRISESNVSTNSSLKEIDIQRDILESCIDSCIDFLLRKVETNNNESLQSIDVTSSECVSNDYETSNKTSVSYIEAIDWKSSNEVDAMQIESNLKQLKNKSEGFIFDGSIQYKKPPVVDEQNVKRNSRAINSNWSKCKKTNVDTKSKDSIKSERPTYSRRNITSNNSQVRIKSNLSIIGDKDNAPNSTRSYNARPNSYNLSEERSRSYAGCYKNDFSSRSAVFPQCEDRRSTTEEGKKGKTKFGKTETHSNHALPTPKSFSKSCIPILKSRLDARKTEHICRPKSPMRGPLTMTGLCRDKINNNDENVNEVNPIPTEGSSVNKKESQQHLDNSKTLETRFKTGSSKENTNVIDENYGNNASRERTIIYVNIINHYDHNVTRILDPEKFLEYTSKGAPIAQNVNESDAKLENDASSSSVIMAQEKDTLPKLVTIVSSVANEANNDENDSNGTSDRHVFTGTSKNFWFVTIHQKEMEVSVKPSVTDTSTSTSDFLKINETMPLHEHQIFGMPKELTNEEYSYLFEILTRKQNLGHLKEIENLCHRLRLGNKNLE
ncbi:protein 175-like isoform X1 [Vespula squamosa]|uniref:Protein 175-like isoform X1 n=1 Tax=Vespula squamosa TaxID=30214 RepID=A0ABD2A5J6_VESSQ